jgi:hypothetical protein
MLSSLIPSETSSAIISTKVRGFSIYENIPHRTSIQYPSAWNKHELLNNDLTIVVMFLAPLTRFFSSTEDAKIRDMIYNESSTTVLVSVRGSVDLHDTSNTLQAITNDQIGLCQSFRNII